MSQKQTTITTSGTSKIAIAVLALVFVFGLFVVGFDCLLYTSDAADE